MFLVYVLFNFHRDYVIRGPFMLRPKQPQLRIPPSPCPRKIKTHRLRFIRALNAEILR
jgi:hypothetical protein